MLRVPTVFRGLMTLGMIVAILVAIYLLWLRYQVEPLTRDGKVRADLVQVAPDVSGLITDVRIHDNEKVDKDQVLLVIDQPRYQLALEQAEATLAERRAALAEATREDRRNHAMSAVVATEATEQGSAKVDELQAGVAQALAARDLARLNLDRTLLRAPVAGTVTNMTLRPGIYLNAGKPAVALVYDRSMRVEGYFEETKLPAIHVGDPASIYLMGLAAEITGHVDSIAGGVEDRERAGGDGELANVNPTFTWVRLAQRIPVRIVIDHVPPSIRLVPGRTATVIVHPRAGEVTGARSIPW